MPIKKSKPKKVSPCSLGNVVANACLDTGNFTANEAKEITAFVNESSKLDWLTLDFAEKYVLNKVIAPGPASKMLVISQTVNSILSEISNGDETLATYKKPLDNKQLHEINIWTKLYVKYRAEYLASGKLLERVTEESIKEKVSLWGELQANGMFKATYQELGYIYAEHSIFSAAMELAKSRNTK